MNKIASISLVTLIFAAGCSASGSGPKTVVVREIVNELEREPVPGTVNGVWSEPMFQDAEVPGSIDPKGVYYRLPHRTIVEIRHEKYQQVQFPEPDGSYLPRER